MARFWNLLAAHIQLEISAHKPHDDPGTWPSIAIVTAAVSRSEWTKGEEQR
jgi:hypothetical protein